MVVPLMLKLAVVAPALTLLPRLAALLNWAGRLSTKLPPVSVEGPALVITKLNVVVAPVATVLAAASLLTPRLTTLVTVPPTVAVLEPRLVVPTGGVTVSVLVKLPVATAVTCTVTVTRPPEGIVTDPWMVVPLMLKLAVVAPALTLLPRLAALLNWAGRLSTKLPPVSVEGPALVITKLNVVVAPVATVLAAASLLTPRLTTLVTVPPTVAVLEPLFIVPVGSRTVRVLV
jgi:hypothetical protein